MSKLSDFLGGAGGAGFGSLPVQVVSVDSTVDSNTSIGINTKDRVVTVTMPASPKIGDMLVFFDAAMTWDINSANVNTNGHPVQYQTTNPTSFELREKAGILSLLFVDSITGWVDTSYYKNAVEPVWYPRVGEEKALHTLTGNHELLHTFNSSGEYTIPSKGLYAFRMAGGGGGAWGGTVGGDSFFKINGSIVAMSRGGKVGSYNSSHGITTIYLYQQLFGSSVSGDVFYTRALPANRELRGVQAGVLPLDTFYVRPASATSTFDGKPIFGEALRSSSIALTLGSGDEVSATVGAGATGALQNANSGRIEIYRIS